MIEVCEALERMLSLAQRLPAQALPLLDALGHHAARDVLATEALPGFDNSAMDGYALRTKDAVRGARLRIIGSQAAGLSARDLEVKHGEAVRIFTGAAIPAGADAVVMQEDTLLHGDYVEIADEVSHGQFIRRAGSDLCKGQVILRAGERITAARVGLLASQGRSHLDIVAPPTAAVMTTGDELLSPGLPLAPGQLYNSNGPMLQALLRQAGLPHVIHTHVTDQREATVETLRQLIAENDVLVASGGVSVGDHDHVRPALNELGLAPDFWRVRMKPGKPFLFAHGEVAGRSKWVFGLPGNPVSSLVTFMVLVKPVLNALLGATGESAHDAAMSTELSNDGDRPLYIRGQLSAGLFTPVGLQRSDALYSLSRSDALVRVEPGEIIPPGSIRPVLV
jgi:molybdopterin molybdotransferase